MPLTPGVCGKFCEFHTPGTVRSITGCLPVSDRVKSFCLRFFGHLARSAPEEDHHRVIAAALRPPTDWRRPIGRPRATWLRTIDEDVQPLNFGVHTAWRKARDRDTLADFHDFSSVTICWKFAIKQLLDFSPHLKRVATLPCEKLTPEN